jgi:predicted porin
MTMKKYALGAAFAAVGVFAQSLPASADKLDDVIARMDAIERSNKQLASENAALRSQLKATKPAPTAPASVVRVVNAPATIPTKALVEPEIDANGHGYLEHKRGNPLTFYTPGGEITAYGNFDISADYTTKAFGGNVNTNPTFTGGSEPFPVGNFGWMPAISTNTSYLGVRGFQRVPSLPFNFVYQLELGYDISATPGLKQTNSQISDNVNGALFNRNTYVGFASPEFGAIKIGKTTAPYENSTGGFNPFAGQIGDMRVIMGNTGGDNRVEFAPRLEHAIWYESPTIGGFQFNALISPGQNRSTISDNIAAGSSDCTGGNDPTEGGLFPNGCNDGSFGTAYSANLSYTNGPFYATVAYERHMNVNRQSDVAGFYGVGGAGITTFQLTDINNKCPLGGTITGSTGATYACFANATQLAVFNADVGDEDAFKVAALYTFTSTKTTIGGIFEMMHRYVSPLIQFQNERQRNGTWAFLTQELTPIDSISFGWAHAFHANGELPQHNSAVTGTPVPGTTVADGNFVVQNTDSSDMVTATYKHKFGPNLTWYSAVAATMNAPTAHYDLGAGGRGVTTDCHSAFGASGGLVSQPHCWVGTTLAGASTGIQWRF